MSNSEQAANLYVKSFFAGSVPAAMEQARRELGSDALLLNSREAPPEARHLGDFEVVFGVWPESIDKTKTAVLAPATVSRAEELHHRMSEIRQMLRRNRSGLAAPSGAGPEEERPFSIGPAGRKRTAKGAVLDIVRPHSAAPDPESSAAAGELASRFEVRPEIGRITALVGPPGSGKTTTLVKLAVNQCLKLGRAVRLISADTLRIGAAEQLRTYAAILGVPFQAAENTVALAQAIDSTPPNTYVLIDTPGFSAAMQQELGGDLAVFLRRRQDIDTHLVLTASMDRAGLRSAIDRFDEFNPGKLIFTRMDETTSAAAVFSEAARTQKPLSFLCHGQSVPEDIEEATKDRVIDSLARQLPDSLQAVA